MPSSAVSDGAAITELAKLNPTIPVHNTKRFDIEPPEMKEEVMHFLRPRDRAWPQLKAKM
jgi:hypothetical protein